MRSLLVAVLNGVVGDEPGVAAASEVVSGRAPSRNVRFVLIGNADRLPVQWRTAAWREVEDELMAVVQEACAVDWLVVTDGEIIPEPRACACQRFLDRDRLD